MPEDTQGKIDVEVNLPHARQKVWRALTEPGLMADWLMRNDFTPEVGHRFSLRGAPTPHWNGVVECELLALEAEARLQFSWRTSGQGAIDTIVTVTLASNERGTRLIVEQAGFAVEAENLMQGARYGWGRFLAKLEQLLARLS